MTNICYNCLDRNIDCGNGEKVAIYWEGNEPDCDGFLTYNQLLARVCQVLFYIFVPFKCLLHSLLSGKLNATTIFFFTRK